MTVQACQHTLRTGRGTLIPCERLQPHRDGWHEAYRPAEIPEPVRDLCPEGPDAVLEVTVTWVLRWRAVGEPEAELAPVEEWHRAGG